MMDILEAHGRFAMRSDRSVFPVDCRATVSTPDGVFEQADWWTATCTALVSLAGMLEDAQTDEDLDEAIEHGKYLLRDGIITEQQMIGEIENVIAELLRWGDAVTSEV